MKTCKTCKYWGVYIKRSCDREGTIYDQSNQDDFYVEADALDDTGLESFLMTGPNFGCIHHEPK
jgi:hypothetical protein